MIRAYKVLGAQRHPCHGGTGQWPPPGEWLRVTGRLVACEHGLHLCRERDLVQWLGPEIWEAEYDESDIVECDDKIVVRTARLVRRCDTWTDRTARLFAADCAERALPIYERRYPEDARPRRAIAAARAYARGEITAAARSAARDAAGAAARSAARSAARAAARAAAGDAAGDAARAWQTDRLLDYLHGRAS